MKRSYPFRFRCLLNKDCILEMENVSEWIVNSIVQRKLHLSLSFCVFIVHCSSFTFSELWKFHEFWKKREKTRARFNGNGHGMRNVKLVLGNFCEWPVATVECQKLVFKYTIPREKLPHPYNIQNYFGSNLPTWYSWLCYKNG